MKYKTTLCPLFVGVLFYGLAAAPAQAAPKWVEIHSPHFVVATDAGEGTGREIALRFEQMRAIFGQMILKDKVNIPIPLQIIAFRNSKELRQYAPLYNGKPIELAGFFQQADDRDYILLDTSGDNSWPTVFHEYAHLLLNGNYPPSDAWFDEGFAEYFSTINTIGDTVQIGKAPEGSMELLRSNRWIPMAELLRVQHDSKIYNVGSGRPLFYAESWVLVHYIYDLNKLRQTALYFNLELDKHVPVEAALQQAFGMTPQQLQHAVEDYYQSPKAVYRNYKLPLNLPKEKTYSAAVLSPLDAQAILGDFDLHSQDHQDQGVTLLEAVLKQDPNNAMAQRGLGYAYLYKHQYDQAAAHFARAAALNSNDPWVHYYVALLKERSGAAASGDTEMIERELKAAIALNPQFADAYNLLGVAEMRNGQLPEAMQHFSAAIRMSPRNEMYISNLALAYLNAHNWEEAASILGRLKNSSDPQIAAMARTNLQKLEEIKQWQAAQQAQSVSLPAGVISHALPNQQASPAASSPAPETLSAESGPILFLKGTLVAVDCTADPAATLTIQAGTQTWKMLTSDYKHLVLINADQFSCSWTGKDVAVNYRQSKPGQGTLVSLEMQ